MGVIGQTASMIWQNAPIWVWPLFVLLLLLGLMSMRDRSSSVILYYFFPLIGLTSIGAINALAHFPANWITYAIGYLIGLVLAFRWQDGLLLEKSSGRVRVKGEAITLVILMTIYFSNFSSGVIEVVAPELKQQLLFTVLFAGIVGACSGSFTGKAVRTVTLGERPGLQVA